jgi:hypothetical protein
MAECKELKAFRHATVDENSAGHSDDVLPVMFSKTIMGVSTTGGWLESNAPLEEELMNGSRDELGIEITLDCEWDASCFDEEG